MMRQCQLPPNVTGQRWRSRALPLLRCPRCRPCSTHPQHRLLHPPLVSSPLQRPCCQSLCHWQCWHGALPVWGAAQPLQPRVALAAAAPALRCITPGQRLVGAAVVSRPCCLVVMLLLCLLPLRSCCWLRCHWEALLLLHRWRPPAHAWRRSGQSLLQHLGALAWARHGPGGRAHEGRAALRQPIGSSQHCAVAPCWVLLHRCWLLLHSQHSTLPALMIICII